MPIAKPPAKFTLPSLNPYERKNCSVLVIEADIDQRTAFRAILQALGYGAVSDAADHVLGIEKLKQRHFTHIIFQAKRTNMTAREFLTAALEYSESIVALPSSFEPSVDDVFNLLVLGARGYVVRPYTQDGLDTAIVMATKGEPISDAILYAKDRNEALASLIMTMHDKKALIMRQAQMFETARRELPKVAFGLQRALDLGRTFAKGGEMALRDAIVEFCTERSNGPASKLGRARKRIEKKKQEEAKTKTQGDDSEDASSSNG